MNFAVCLYTAGQCYKIISCVQNHWSCRIAESLRLHGVSVALTCICILFLPEPCNAPGEPGVHAPPAGCTSSSLTGRERLGAEKRGHPLPFPLCPHTQSKWKGEHLGTDVLGLLALMFLRMALPSLVLDVGSGLRGKCGLWGCSAQW